MNPWATSIYLVQVYPGSVNYGTVLVLFIEIMFVYIVNSVQKFAYCGSGLSNWQGFTSLVPRPHPAFHRPGNEARVSPLDLIRVSSFSQTENESTLV